MTDNLSHNLHMERETTERARSSEWVEREPTGYARTTCSCGLDTGLVEDGAAARVLRGHLETADA